MYYTAMQNRFLFLLFKRKYKLSKSEEEEKPILRRLGLHAYQLKFKDANANEYSFEAPLPKDMRALVNQLKKI